MKNVLIVEDSSTMRSLIVSTVEIIEDVSVTETASGFEALKILPQKKFDLIMTDINMPDINGLELAKFVKTNVDYKDIPLIIISTEGSEKDRERGMQLGADEYVIKPFKPEQLQKLIMKYLKR
ncbi:MAG: response regulator [bacterium]|nr:response regulator [bacterium]